MSDASLRILVLAPVGRDAKLITTILAEAGIDAVSSVGPDGLRDRLVEGCGAVLVTEEALDHQGMALIAGVIEKQPPWSDVPIMILTEAPALEIRMRSFEDLGSRANLTLVDRPVRIKTLISTVESALRSRRRQYELRDLMSQLEERVHERDRFLAILGHELRNPLGAILLASQMADPEDGTLDRDHVALIERQSRHLTRLVDDLLNLSRITAGKIVLQKSLVDLRRVVEDALAAVERISPRRIDLTLPAAPVVVDADPARLEQVVVNLLTNAVKYTPDDGRIELRVDSRGDAAVVRVRDTGAGIPPEQLESVFGLFSQANNADLTKGGMGIGLALVRDLVQLHGGQVYALSEGIGQGSEFIVRLPASSGELDAEVPQLFRPAGERKDARTIVLVEDNRDVRMLLQLKLRRLGHQVIPASNGIEGLKMILEVQPDLALVDISMPGIDGYEVAARVRKEPGMERIYMVALSGFGQPEDKRRSREAGFDEHVTKPIDANEIERLLDRVDRLRTTDRGGLQEERAALP